MFLKGTLVSEEYDHDFTAGDMRVSVKARKGRSGITSIISRIEGEGCPTHLMFIQFSDGYSLERIYLFPWGYLLEHRRFKEKTVRGGRRGYYMSVGPSRDSEFLIYSRSATLFSPERHQPGRETSVPAESPRSGQPHRQPLSRPLPHLRPGQS